MISIAFLKKLRSNNYLSLGLVGSGQFGQVYCAVHRRTGRLVALKNLNRDRFPTYQFLRELRFLLSLNHPHIANCLALEQSTDARQLVLDYCEGGTLRDLLEQGTQLTLAEILTIISEVLEALEHAQNASIVHCDIKPENILLTLTADGWRVKVSDFGIARLSQELQGEQRGATGSPAYMAPERFYYQYAVASDLYAVGIILYELILGDRPFSGNYSQLMVAHLNHAVKIPDSLPVAVRSLLSKSMEKLSARRFQSAAEMQTAISTTRQTLTASELCTCFPKSSSSPPIQQFVPQTAMMLRSPCAGLSVIDQHQTTIIIAFSGQKAWGWSLTDAGNVMKHRPDHGWELPDLIVELNKTASGAIAVTHRDVYRLVPGQPPQTLATFIEPMQLIASGHRWLMVQTQAKSSQLWLIDTVDQAPQSPQRLDLVRPSGRLLGLVLDNRHLLLADAQDDATDLHISSRHGQAYGNLTVHSPLHRLIPTQEMVRFLAQAGTQKRDLLIIQLRPYRVIRCRLDITADWVGELLTGFAIVSKDGCLCLINYQGQIIGNVKGLPKPTAIAFHPPYRIWLASVSTEAAQLHCIDIRTLGLEIVF